MYDILLQAVSNPRILTMAFSAIAAIATVLTLAMPLLATDTLAKRMKSVALEREQLRQRERERMARGEKIALRRTPKQYMQSIVDQFNLNKWVGQETARALLDFLGLEARRPADYAGLIQPREAKLLASVAQRRDRILEQNAAYCRRFQV